MSYLWLLLEKEKKEKIDVWKYTYIIQKSVDVNIERNLMARGNKCAIVNLIFNNWF